MNNILARFKFFKFPLEVVDIILFMNNAKFSLNPLPGDSWETRYSKTIVRNISRLKEERGLTTAQLAERCNEFLGLDGEIKISALNGLFAGKRKSINIAECHMFAAVLRVPLLAILYPLVSDRVETRPGRHPLVADAVLDAAGLSSPGDPDMTDEYFEPDLGAYDTQTLRFIFEYWSAQEALTDATGDAARAVLRGANESELQYFASNLIYPSMNFLRLHKKLAERDITVGNLRFELHWVFGVTASKIDVELLKAIIAPAYLDSISDRESKLRRAFEKKISDGSSA